MANEEGIPGSGIQGPIVSACADRQTREIKIVEGPCPLCGGLQEYFSDELLTKNELRCRDCGGLFEVEPHRKNFGL
ncbi:MAG: hypothetical protein LBJ61_12845 [Deltaproteobacteria bacterium]|nr:hypothetical protein [Deltaproteobacteria bacterium]